MAVYKRGQKGIFYMNFTINGVRVFRSTGKFTKKEAKLIEAVEKKKMMEESKLSPQERTSKLLLSDAIDQTYEGKWKNNKDGNGTYARALKLVDFMGNITLDQINEDIVHELIMKLEARKVQPSTANRYLATLKTILRFKRQPWDYIKLRKERNGRIRVITKAEESIIVGLLRNAEQTGKKTYYTEAADLMEVLVDTGMRLSELLNLTYADISFCSNLISIWINKGERPRSIPMTKRVRVIMEERQQISSVKPFSITIHETERAWQWIRAEIGLVGDKEFVIHALRHTCASRLVNAGIDLYVVKEWLGHSSIQITERYAHLNPVKLVHAVEVLEQ
ncbi:MAG: site-specific integrase [Steroidobacteraceae bacterium]|nr:site-specific integrase [Deltaproteobacteria bacterium]